MPTLESNRRIIGRDLIQRYITDGGENMTITGRVIGSGNYETGFKPKIIIIAIEEDTYVFTEYGYMNLYDYDILDYNNRERTVVKQNIRTSISSLIEFKASGFTLSVGVVDGFYIAIG